MGKPGQIITFYSYKGGTGRTMAVANAASVLARRLAAGGATDTRVLAIDWDFEAPGLHRYFLPFLPTGTRDSFDARPGCIDLLQAVHVRRADFGKDSFRNRTQARSILKDIDFDQYVIRTTIPCLGFIKSGRHDADYARTVNAFDWEDFFYTTEGFFPGLADYLGGAFDYVLIDSRTGVTDTSGICTMLLPDKLVVPFTANTQSLAGIEDVVRRAVNYRRQSEDWRPLSVFPLPSRIDISRPTLAEQWRNGVAMDLRRSDPGARTGDIEGYQPVFERLMTELYGPDGGDLGKYFDEVVLQHVPDYAYGEPIAVELETTDSRIFLRRSYENFVDRLTELSGPWESLEANRRDRDFAGQIAKMRERLDDAIARNDVKASEELLRLGFGLVESQVGAGNLDDTVDLALAIARFGIRTNTTTAALLASSAVDYAGKFATDDWQVQEQALRQAAALFDDAGIYDNAVQVPDAGIWSF